MISPILHWPSKIQKCWYKDIYSFSSTTTIPNNLTQRDSRIFVKHSNQYFHESDYIACQKLEPIHSNLCGNMPIVSAKCNKYSMSFIDDYTSICWLYLLKDKSQAFETFNNFHVWI